MVWKGTQRLTLHGIGARSQEPLSRTATPAINRDIQGRIAVLSEFRAPFLNGAQPSVNRKVRVRIPAPEPNCIGNRESVTELAGERTATVQQRTGEVGAGWHDVYDWLISVGWYFSCLSRKLAVENRNAHFRRQPFFNRKSDGRLAGTANPSELRTGAPKAERRTL